VTDEAGTVRRLRVGESALLRELRLTSLRDTPTAFGRTLAEALAEPDSYWTEMERSVTEPGRHVMFLAEDGPRAIGVAFGIRRPDGIAHLGGMWVDPGARKRGFGRRLGQSVIDWARVEGFPHLDLWVTDGNSAARTLYERLGFVVTGGRDRLPWNPALAIVEMRLHLERGAVSR
jgi:GNAT superfamily N-acetyltransferase